MKDEWVAAALFDDSVVAELLSRLKQSSSSSSSFSCQPFPLPFGWGHRQPRSRPTPTNNKKDSTTSTAPTTTRCSPTTPLSWSGGATSPSDGAYDDCSNSSTTLPPLSTSYSSDPSRSKGAFPVDATNVYGSNKKSKKKKTFAELKEEENLLLRERVTLKRELASLHVTLQEQKARSENLKRFKIDLNLQTSGEMCVAAGDRQVVVANECSQMEVSTCDHAHPSVPRLAVQDGFVSSGSSRVEKEVDLQKSCFVLPDLNMTPSEEEFGPETLRAIH